ncbi:hypothetical protein ACGFNX_39715 [Streptomyces sp. NPDC048723]|uniref:hypothetical protein n=1 Tax=Streptomyces sp. NPDC048723 TaxID=3365589 RepID=UPI003723CB0B
MTTIKRAAVAAVAMVAVAAPDGPSATAVPAYKCASSTKDSDDTSHDGPWPDNWKVMVRTCRPGPGHRVRVRYAYAEVLWDGAGYYPVDDPTIFDGAELRVQIKQSREGADPVVAERDFPQREARLEDSTFSGARTGTYRTATISHRAGAAALGDSVLFLDWDGDGRGYQRHHDTAAPTV